MSGQADVAATASAILDELERAIVGKRDVLELVLIALLADGHVLLEDVPGTAKTLMARSFAEVMGMRFTRIQFTPDLLPSDVTGSAFFDQRRGEFEFRPGPIFANLLLADEINRAPPKTQAALLEGMQERQVTAEGETRPLPRPFLVLATQNPVEFEGTYELPEAQLDRFLLRTSVGQLGRDDEWTMVRKRLDRKQEEVNLDVVCDSSTVVELQRAIEDVHVSEAVGMYVIDVVAATRASGKAELGAGPRGTLALVKAARARAALSGRDFVTPEDVKALAVPALGHRIVVKPELWVQRVRGEAVVEDALTRVPTPQAEDLAQAS